MDQIEGSALTPKNALFVRLLLDGVSTVEAHKKAGYKGDPHAAYELRSKLRWYLRQEAANRGISADGIAVDLAALDSLPVLQPAVNVKEKLAIIAAKQKLIEMEAPPPNKKEGYMRLEVVDAVIVPPRESPATEAAPGIPAQIEAKAGA
jgi:hypothetical protein